MAAEVIKGGDTIVQRDVLRWGDFPKVMKGSIGIVDVAARIEDIVALVSGNDFFYLCRIEEVGREMVFFKCTSASVI